MTEKGEGQTGAYNSQDLGERAAKPEGQNEEENEKNIEEK